MGVGAILQPILRSAGRPIDLRDFSGPITSRRGKRTRVQSLRVGIDVSGWIQKACFGFSDMLASEEYLTNHGRATLLQKRSKIESETESIVATQTDLAKRDNDLDTTTNDNCHTKIDEAATASKTDVDVKQAEYVNKCIEYVLKRLKLLQDQCKMEILVVLEGKTPPVKQAEVDVRRKLRQQYVDVRDRTHKTNGADYNINIVDESAAKAVMNQWLVANRRAGAGKHFIVVVQELMKLLRQEKIPFLVAPYEADSQLAYMSRCRYLDLVVTDDSDLIVSCTCPIVYKLFDQQRGEVTSSCQPKGILIRPEEDLGALCLDTNSRMSLTLDFLDYTPAMLAVLFVVLGCDYSVSSKIKGIGIVSACRMIREAFYPHNIGRKLKNGEGTHTDADKIQSNSACSPLHLLFLQLHRFRRGSNVLDKDEETEYQHRFMSAIIMYRHPIVYDPITGCCIAMGLPNDYETDGNLVGCFGDPELISYEPYRLLLQNESKRLNDITGHPFEASIATLIAEGWISPRTCQPYVSIEVKEKHQSSTTSASPDENEQTLGMVDYIGFKDDIVSYSALLEDDDRSIEDENYGYTDPDRFGLETQEMYLEALQPVEC